MRFLLCLCFLLGMPTVWAQAPITDILMLEVPAGSLDPETLAANLETLDWQKTYNGAGFMARARHDYYLRLRAPVGDAAGYVLHHPFRETGPNDRDYNFNLFVVERSQLIPVPVWENRFASFFIGPELYGKTLVSKTRTGPFATALTMDLRTFHPQDMERKARQDLFFLGLVNGIIAIMSIYNLGLLLLFRKPYLFYYTLYTLAALYWLNLAMGMLWFDTIMILSFHLAVEMIHICTILFSFSVLDARQQFPRLHRVSRFSIGISLGLLTLILLGVEKAVYVYYSFITLTFMLCFLLAARAAARGDRSAYPMVLGWAALFVGSLMSSLPTFVEQIPNLEWALPLAISIEIATFSFAIGQKLRISELTFQRENEHAFGEMRKMIYPHQLERVRRGEHLEDTMPTHAGEALVISFDIIGSSRMKDINTRKLFRMVFARCNEIMAEGYDGRELKSRAYRIKEMGDGFLCSIGYPFAMLSPNPAHEALMLARRFAAVLAEVAASMQFQEPVVCGIGIAWDDITGFYPEAGAKEYDLYGRAIVLATRYEGMRKVLFQEQTDRSLLILQDKVFEALDAEDRVEFQTVDLEARGIIVRDDPRATRLFVSWSHAQPEIPGGPLTRAV